MNRIRKFVAIEVRPEGNYGNHLIELLNAFFFALVTNVKILYCRYNLCWLPKNLTFTTRENICVIVLARHSTIALSRELWLSQGWPFPGVWCEDFTWSYAMDSLRKFLLQGIPSAPADPSTLYLFMRGGRDIWNGSRHVHPLYRQPPCSFYLGAMRGFPKVQVIGDKWNPCTEMAIRAGAHWEPYNDQRDMGIMVNSRFIVLATSSLSQAILALSPIKKRFWYFNQKHQRRREPICWRGFAPTDFGNGTNCVVSPEFETALGRWMASDLQKQLIRNQSCYCEPM
jgi:hypothetical protein